MKVVLHTNPTLANQVETAEWLRQGFERHGIDAEVTSHPHKAGDVQVVQGPHYCFEYWRKRSGLRPVLWLNRTYYGHPRWMISLGWLRPDGSRDFRNGGMAAGKGTLPQLKSLKEGRRRAAVFADYGRDPAPEIEQALGRFEEVACRPHPQQPAIEAAVPLLNKPRWGLDDVFAWADVAIGHSSTVLVEAKIAGLHVESTDPLHVVQDDDGDRQAWLNRLSWACWSHEELKNGAFWEHLCIT